MLYSTQPSLIYVYQPKTVSANDHLNSMARRLEANVGKSLSPAGNADFYPCYSLPHCRYSVEISRLLWNTKPYYCAYESPLLDAVMTQINRSHFLKQRFLKDQFNIILPFTPRSLRCALSFRISVLSTILLFREQNRFSMSWLCIFSVLLLHSVYLVTSRPHHTLNKLCP